MDVSYDTSKSYNFNTKLNYLFNTMKNQALVTLVVVHVSVTAPSWLKVYKWLPCLGEASNPHV
jgi:hypothetical protein